MARAKQKSEVKATTDKTGATEATTGMQKRTRQHGDVIAEVAYYKAEKRGFAPGNEMQDWLEAEQEINESAVQH